MSEENDFALYDAEFSDSDLDSDEEDEIDSSEDSEASDGEDGTDEEEVEVQPTGVSSSEDNGENESCPVCLNHFIGQDLGSPENCEHVFCLVCIIEWSKNINTCPIDRTEFNYVHLKTKPGGKVLKKIKVKVQPKEPEDALQEDVTLCEICHLGDQPDRLLLCDGCDLAFHLQCLDPPLFHVPINEWYCPSCASVLENCAVAGPSTSRYQRIIPRTRTSENVRVRVQNKRTQAGARRSISSASPSKPQKRKRRTYRRCIKKVVKLARTKKHLVETGKGKSCSANTAVVVTYRRKRYRRKRRKIETKNASTSKFHSVKDRISRNLGLVKSSNSLTAPSIKSKAKASSSSAASGSSCSLFGNKDQLMDFNECYHEDVPGPSNWKPEGKKEISSSFNLLDTIIAGQKMLHTKSENVVINTDGSLIFKEKKMKKKSLVKEPSTFEKPKTGQNSNTCNTKLQNAVKTNDSSKDCKIKEKIATKKDSFDKSKSVAPLEPSLGDIPKIQNKDSEKMSPMLLAALARRKENEKVNMSVSNMKDKKRVSFSDEKKYFESEYISVEDNTELKRENQNSSLECSKLQSYKFESETDRRILKNKKENDSLNLNSNCSLNSNFNFNPCDSHSFETEQSFKKEQSYSIDEKCVKKETGGFLKNRSTENVYSRITTISDDDNIMDMNSSQSLLQTDSNQSILLLNCTKNLHVNIKEEPNSSSEESDLEESQSLISPFKMQHESKLSLYSSSNRLKKSETNIKEELSFKNNDYSISYLEKDFSVSKSNFQPVKSIQRLECPQSLFQTATDIDSTQRKIITGKCFKKELHSSDEETNFLNSNGCSKSANKLLDKQMKIKDEPPSSDDERRHMSPVAQFTNDLSNNRHTLRSPMQCIDFSHTKKSDINSKIAEFTCDSNDLSCTQLAESSSNSLIHSKKQLDNLPCTQLAEHCSKEQLDSLPCTQLAEHRSKRLTDDLPFPQLSEQCSKEQSDNLPCTQLAEHRFKELIDDLPCTQLAEHRSKDLTDDLPCTQLAEPHFQNLLDDLPCTQLAEHHSKKQLDYLPCTQLAEHCLEERADNLPCTQLVEHRSKDLTDDLPCAQLAEPHFQNLLDDLPCTQLAEHHSKKQLDYLPCTQLAEHRSEELTDDLPCTQLAEHCSKEQADNLPCTQLAEHHSKELTDDLPCTQLAEHCLEERADNLLCTQLAEHCSREQLDNLSHIQLSKLCPEEKLENLPYKLLSDGNVVPLQNNSDNLNKIPCNFESDLLESRSHALDDSHSKLLKFLKEKSKDEIFSEEREQISALLLRSGNLEVKKSIKKIGGHKNLPQVLMHASLKHIPVPKPTNKKTFSFDQVKQYYGLKEDKETSNNNIINKENGFISLTGKSSIESSRILFPSKHLVKYAARVDGNILKSDVKDNEDEIEIIAMNPENVKKEKEIQEVVVSSDDEDFPQIQLHDIFSNKILDCNLKDLNQKSCVSFSCISIKQEKVIDNHLAYINEKKICNKVEDSVSLSGNINRIIKKETDGINFKEHSKTINSLNSSALIKKEKVVCSKEKKENLLEKNKIKSSLQLKSEKSISRKIKHENKMDDAVESRDQRVKKEKHDSERKSSRNQDLAASNDCNFLKEELTKNNVEQNNFNIRRDKRKSEVDHYTNEKIQVKDKSLSMSDLKKQDITKEKHMSKRTNENKDKCVSKNSTITECRKIKTFENKGKYDGRNNEMMQSIEKHVGKDNKTISSKEKHDSKSKITSLSNSENKLVGNGKLVTEKRKLSSRDVEKNSYNNKRYKMELSEDSGKVRNNEKKHITKEKSDKDRKKSLDCSSNSRNAVITIKYNNELEKKFKNVHEENGISKKDSSKFSLGKKCPSKSVIPHSNEKKGAQESDHKLTNGSIKNFNDVKNEKLLNSNIYSTQFNALRTNMKKEPSNTSNVLMLEREKTIMGNVKERRMSTFSESPSYSEDTCDSFSSPAVRSKVLTKKYPENFKHQKNALTVLNQVADEIIAFSDKSKSHIFLDEPVDLDIIKKGCDSFKGRKVDRKHIKDEIAEEVKIALKPFYTSGLIDKEEYKDIMRKAVPKVYLNCGHYVNPEKIKSLVTNYIKRLSNS